MLKINDIKILFLNIILPVENNKSIFTLFILVYLNLIIILHKILYIFILDKMNINTLYLDLIVLKIKLLILLLVLSKPDISINLTLVLVLNNLYLIDIDILLLLLLDFFLSI